MVLEAPDNWTEHFVKLGYTVFVSNSRGNYYSLNHTTLHSNFRGIPLIKSDPLFDQYWDFTFHDLAQSDLTAFITKIRDITGLEKIK